MAKLFAQGVGEVGLQAMTKEQLVDYCDRRGYPDVVRSRWTKDEIIKRIMRLKRENVDCKCKKCERHAAKRAAKDAAKRKAKKKAKKLPCTPGKVKKQKKTTLKNSRSPFNFGNE